MGDHVGIPGVVLLQHFVNPHQVIFLQTFCLYLTNLFCPLIICNKSDLINFFPRLSPPVILSRSLLESYQQKEFQYVTCFNKAHKTHMNHHEHSWWVVVMVKMDGLYANIVILKA